MKIQLATIRVKLILSSAGITFALIILGFLIFHYVNRIQSYSQLIQPVSKFKDNLNKLHEAENDFLQSSSHQSDFIEIATDENINRFHDNYKLDKQLISDLITNDYIHDISDTSLVPLLIKLQNDLDYYNQKFNQLQLLIKERGHLHSGISGDWENVEQKIEERISVYGNKSLDIFVRDLQKLRYEYLFSGNMKTIHKIDTLSKTYKKLLRTGSTLENLNNIPEIERFALANEIEKFSSYADLISEKDTVLGFFDQTGLTLNLHLLVTSMNKDLDKSIEIIGIAAEQEVSQARRNLTILLVFIIVGSALLLTWLANIIITPLNKIQTYITGLSMGKLPEQVILSSDNEIASMLKILNRFADKLHDKVEFASKIGKGEYDESFTAISNEDVLGLALVEMQQSLKKADENEEIRKIEEQKRNWAALGITQFAGILRMDNDSLERLSHNTIKNLVKYLDATQGAIFTLNDSNPDHTFLDLTAAFAYDRNRKLKRQFDLDEGLIGRCVDEKSTVFMTELPADYMRITSGLGDSPPRCLMIVPMITNDTIFGVLEIASLNIFEAYQIEFVEKAAEMIASTLSSVKINQQTQQLLAQSQQQAEFLSAQEEELRQNLEELQTTQEEAARKEAAMNSLINAIDSTAYAIEYNLDGTIVRVSRKVEEILGIASTRLIGESIAKYVDFESDDNFMRFWKDIIKKQSQHRLTHIILDDKEIWLDETYTPIYDHNGEPIKILCIGYDITDVRRMEKEIRHDKDQLLMQEQVMQQNMAEVEGLVTEYFGLKTTVQQLKTAIDESVVYLEYDTNAIVLDANKQAELLFGQKTAELKGLKYSDLFLSNDIEDSTIWRNLCNGIGQTTISTPVIAPEKMYSETLTPILDEQGNIAKIISIATMVSTNAL